MTELEDQLTSALHHRADNVRIDDRLTTIVDDLAFADPQPPNHRRRNGLVFAGAATLLLLAGTLATRQLDDEPRSPSSASELTVTADASPTASTAQDLPPDADPTTTTTLVVAPTTTVQTASTDCLPTFRFDDVDLEAPANVSGDEVRFTSEIIGPEDEDGVPVLQTQVLEAPTGTAIVEIIVNGRSRGGGSYNPGSVHVVPLREETTALIEVCAYDGDRQLIGSVRADEALTIG